MHWAALAARYWWVALIVLAGVFFGLWRMADERAERYRAERDGLSANATALDASRAACSASVAELHRQLAEKPAQANKALAEAVVRQAESRGLVKALREAGPAQACEASQEARDAWEALK